MAERFGYVNVTRNWALRAFLKRVSARTLKRRKKERERERE